jgi:hypothetical protein
MKKRKKAFGQLVNKQYSGGLNVSEFWVKLFQTNQENFTAGKLDKVLVDEQITSALQIAFPDRKTSAIFGQPNRVRNRYNRGILTRGQIPKQKSVKFQRTESGVVPQKLSFTRKKQKK